MTLVLLLLLLAVLTVYAGHAWRTVQVLAWMDTDGFRNNDMSGAPKFVKLKRDTSHDHVQKTVEGYLHAHCSWSFPWTFTCYFHNPGGGGGGGTVQ